MAWLCYRVLPIRSDDDGAQSWNLLRNEIIIAMFASSFGAEAEGRRRAHVDCLSGQNAKLIVHSLDGSIDAEFTFTAPECE